MHTQKLNLKHSLSKIVISIFNKEMKLLFIETISSYATNFHVSNFCSLRRSIEINNFNLTMFLSIWLWIHRFAFCDSEFKSDIATHHWWDSSVTYSIFTYNWYKEQFESNRRAIKLSGNLQGSMASSCLYRVGNVWDVACPTGRGFSSRRTRPYKLILARETAPVFE